MNKLIRTKWHKIKPHNIRHDVEASRPTSTSDVTLHKDHLERLDYCQCSSKVYHQPTSPVRVHAIDAIIIEFGNICAREENRLVS